MSDVVYLLGAGFDHSLMDRHWQYPPPLARNFFQLLIKAGVLPDRSGDIKRWLDIDLLLAEIQRYWHLSVEDLATTPLDIEECLTLFQLQEADGPRERKLELERAQVALRGLLLMYLGGLLPLPTSPAARRFGEEVVGESADVLTFNYDTLAEGAIQLGSGVGDKPNTGSPLTPDVLEVRDEDLDASHYAWNRNLAYGFKFIEVPLPISGATFDIPGDRYYSHPNNRLYDSTRVLKLHGSIDWLTYTTQPEPGWEGLAEQLEAQGNTSTSSQSRPGGIVLDKSREYDPRPDPPSRGGWLMDPVIIPPHLYKNYGDSPFTVVWKKARETLSACSKLVVIGYSFPPTDFGTRRLLLEAFSENALRELVVVNPDTGILQIVRKLTHYSGPATACDDLPSLYGSPN